MAEPRYMLMILADEDSAGFRRWAAANVEGTGRTFTREQVEALAAQIEVSPRFVFPLTDQTEVFARDDAPPTLVMQPGETIWTYGEPAQTDMFEVLRSVADGAESPSPADVLLPVEEVVSAAVARFGEADPHDVEATFDVLVMSMGGKRQDEPASYRLPLEWVVLGG